jgi:hypothetical protein
LFLVLQNSKRLILCTIGETVEIKAIVADDASELFSASNMIGVQIEVINGTVVDILHSFAASPTDKGISRAEILDRIEVFGGLSGSYVTFNARARTAIRILKTLKVPKRRREMTKRLNEGSFLIFFRLV